MLYQHLKMAHLFVLLVPQVQDGPAITTYTSWMEAAVNPMRMRVPQGPILCISAGNHATVQFRVKGGGGETKDGKEKIKKKMITNKTGLKQREVEPKRSGCQPKVRWAGGGWTGKAGQEHLARLWGCHYLAHSRSQVACGAHTKCQAL